MALTLSRKATQSIYIGTARVTVKRIQRGRVIFDIDAPRDVPICRSEIAAAARAKSESDFANLLRAALHPAQPETKEAT